MQELRRAVDLGGNSVCADGVFSGVSLMTAMLENLHSFGAASSDCPYRPVIQPLFGVWPRKSMIFVPLMVSVAALMPVVTLS